MTIDRALERAKLLCVKAGLDPEGLQRMESDQGPCFVTADFTHGLVPGYDEFLVMSPQFVSMKDLANRQLPQSLYTVRTSDAFDFGGPFDRRKPTVSHAADGTVDHDKLRGVTRALQSFNLNRRNFGQLDYSKIHSDMLDRNHNDFELSRVESFIRSNPGMGPNEMYSTLMKARGYDVPAVVACPACGREDPEPDFYEPGNRRMLRVEWLVWYAMKHNASSQMAWEAGAKKVIEAEFGEKTRWRVTAYTDPNDPRLVRIKYNDN
jgi:hypothetical protein